MTDHCPLTDEELDAMEHRYTRTTTAVSCIPRLIADLRAARQRNVELTEQADANARLAAQIGAEREVALADLRAARERVKELEDGIEAFLSGRNPL